MMQKERSKEHDEKDEELMRANGAIANGCDKAGGGGGGGGGGERGRSSACKRGRARDLGRHGCFQQSTRGITKSYMLWELVLKKKRKEKKLRLGRLEGSSEPKRWIWALFSDEREKG